MSGEELFVIKFYEPINEYGDMRQDFIASILNYDMNDTLRPEFYTYDDSREDYVNFSFCRP